MTLRAVLSALLIVSGGFCFAPNHREENRGQENHGQENHGQKWFLPNFANRLSVRVVNPGPGGMKALVTLPIPKIRNTAPDFPGRLALAVILDPGNPSQPGTVVPSQADDLDGDGDPDTFEFPIDLPAGAGKDVDIYYSTTLNDKFEWPKHASAKHSCGYNHQVAALESDFVGYRMYGGFFLDVHGRKPGNPGLWNDAAAYIPVTRDLGTGRDVLHIGNTLGLGGVFLRREGSIYQPPMNVPDYAHKPSPEAVPHYRVIAQGPLRAIFEAELPNWSVDGDVVRLQARYSIDAGEMFVRCHVEATPIKIQPGHAFEVGIGIRELPRGSASSSPRALVVDGEQNPRDGRIALAIYFDGEKYLHPTLVRTPDGNNRAVLSKTELKPNSPVELTYSAAGAWSGSGIENPAEFLQQLQPQVGQATTVNVLGFARTPHPEKLDAEAQ